MLNTGPLAKECLGKIDLMTSNFSFLLYYLLSVLFI